MPKSPPTKRLALICQHFYPEMISTGLFITQLATGLAQMGWAVRVYCGRPIYEEGVEQPISPSYETYQGVEIIRVPAWGSGRGALWQRALNAITFLLFVGWRLLRDRRILYGVVNTTNPPFLGLLAVLVRRLVGLPFVTVVHDLYPEVAIRLGLLSSTSLVTRTWEWLTRCILEHSAGVVVIGRDMEQLVRSKLKDPSTAKVTLIPHWSDVEQTPPANAEIKAFLQQHGIQDKLVVQYAGRLGRIHNLEVLLDAAHLLQNEPVHFQFIGDGAKRRALSAKAQQLKLTNVQFLPSQPYHELPTMLAAAQVGVVCLESNCTGVSVPSKSYGIMASRRPILALLDRASEIGQMVQETGCGLVLDAATGIEVATAIRQLQANPAQLCALGERGYQAFQQNYTQALALKRYAAFLESHLPVVD
ncbi:MAG: glycosyltransferase family 4 protein [Caldilineaceae bacterium]